MSASGTGKKPAPTREAPAATPDTDDEEVDNNDLKKELDGVKALVKGLLSNLNERFGTVADATKVGEAFTDLAARIDAIKSRDRSPLPVNTGGGRLKVAK